MINPEPFEYTICKHCISTCSRCLDTSFISVLRYLIVKHLHFYPGALWMGLRNAQPLL